MKKVILITVIIGVLILSACTGPDNAKIDDKWGLQLSAKDVTSESLTIVFQQSGGSPSGELQTGSWFSLEVHDQNEWKPLETNPLIDYAWNSIAYRIKKNEATELKTEWKWLYGELSIGSYRLGKKVMDFRKSGDFDEEIYYVYFTID